MSSEPIPAMRLTVPIEPEPKPVTSEDVERIIARMDEMYVQLNRIEGDMAVLRGEAQTMAQWRGEVESWRSKTSDRVKQTSSDNLAQDSAISQVMTKLAEVESKVSTGVDTINRIDRRATELIKNPKVIAVLLVLWTILSKWAEKHGYM